MGHGQRRLHLRQVVESELLRCGFDDSVQTSQEVADEGPLLPGQRHLAAVLIAVDRIGVTDRDDGSVGEGLRDLGVGEPQLCPHLLDGAEPQVLFVAARPGSQAHRAYRGETRVVTTKAHNDQARLQFAIMLITAPLVKLGAGLAGLGFNPDPPIRMVGDGWLSVACSENALTGWEIGARLGLSIHRHAGHL